MKNVLIAIMICFTCSAARAQVKPLTNAHAHNDYEHARPLMDALSYGFTSVEADSYLINEVLYVSHNYPVDLKGITLKELYLDPLQRRLKQNNNRIYPNYEGVFYLLIDLKNEPAATYQKLHQLISGYPEFINNPGFKIYLSGADLLYTLKNPDRILSLDGRIKDLDKGFTNEDMPVISESFSKVTSWDRKQPVTEAQWHLAKSFIEKVHQKGKKCRLWAVPDTKETWQRLLDYRIDFINTDKLQELAAYLNNK